MASADERLEFTDEEFADLTDAELVESHHRMIAEIEQLRQIPDAWSGLGMSEAWVAQMMELAGSERGAPDESTEEGVRYSRCWAFRSLIEGEMGRRLIEMLRNARLALGLSQREVAQVAGIHSKLVDEIENGRAWTTFRRLFERACTKGGLEKAEESFHRSVWFPLADPRLCRTIREVGVDPSWLSENDGAALALAGSIRESRAFHLLPVLGDALEEAGCVDPAILYHCRSPGEHARGCWVTDALVRAARRR